MARKNSQSNCFAMSINILCVKSGGNAEITYLNFVPFYFNFHSFLTPKLLGQISASVMALLFSMVVANGKVWWP